MTDKTLTADGIVFDRAQIYNIGDAIVELIHDRFYDTFVEMASNAIGEQKADETEDDYLERLDEAASVAFTLAIRSINNDTDEFETERN